MSRLTMEIEERVAEEAGLAVAVEEDGERIVLTGLVTTDEERQAALDIAAGLAQDRVVEDNLEVDGTLSAEVEGLPLSEVEVGGFEGATEDADPEDSLEAGDFTDQSTLVYPDAASGPSTSLDDAVSEGDEVYVPPTDPVGTNTEIIGGLQTSSMQSIEVERSSDGTLGDEAIADAIRRELREDAATTALEIEVEVRQGVARVRGRVADVEDSENVAEVASRVPGVVEVLEETQVEGM